MSGVLLEVVTNVPPPPPAPYGLKPLLLPPTPPTITFSTAPGTTATVPVICAPWPPTSTGPFVLQVPP